VERPWFEPAAIIRASLASPAALNLARRPGSCVFWLSYMPCFFYLLAGFSPRCGTPFALYMYVQFIPIDKFFHLQSHKSFSLYHLQFSQLRYLVSEPLPCSAMSVLSPRRLRAKIAPHLTLRVPFKAGIYENSPRWSNKDLDPIPPEQRTWGGLVSQVSSSFATRSDSRF
jgi:hypothetical protein